MEVKIKFSNGTEIFAELNGDSYIVAKKPEFPTNLKNVQIVDENNEVTTVENAQIIECASIDNRYWFAIRETPVDVLRNNAIATKLADIEDALCELSKE